MKRVHAHLASVKSKQFEEALNKLKTNNKSGRLEVLELGIGTGLNFKYFPKNSNITILDKTDIFLPLLKESITKNNRNDLSVSKLVINKAEEMISIESESMDVVVHTFILCSVDNSDQVLKEIHRVLKPGGIYIFLEHSLDEDNLWRRVLQRLIKPMCGDCKFLKMKNILSKFNGDVNLRKYFINTKLFTFINPVVYGYSQKN